MTVKRPIAYITAAWSGSRTTDQERAAKYCRQVYEAGYSPICPNLFLPMFLHESIPQEHKDGLDMAREYLRRSRLLVMCGEQVDETVKNDAGRRRGPALCPGRTCPGGTTLRYSLNACAH